MTIIVLKSVMKLHIYLSRYHNPLIIISLLLHLNFQKDINLTADVSNMFPI